MRSQIVKVSDVWELSKAAPPQMMLRQGLSTTHSESLLKRASASQQAPGSPRSYSDVPGLSDFQTKPRNPNETILTYASLLRRVTSLRTDIGAQDKRF